MSISDNIAYSLGILLCQMKKASELFMAQKHFSVDYGFCVFLSILVAL